MAWRGTTVSKEPPLDWRRASETYRNVAGDEVLEAIERAAAKLHGLRVLNVCSSGRGGGVAEILKRLNCLMQADGLQVSWEVLRGSEPFLAVTKEIHRALQGTSRSLSAEDWQLYRSEVLAWGARLNIEADIVLIHDPQPLPLIELAGEGQRWVWRCHIDLAAPDNQIWEPLAQDYISAYHAAVASTDISARPMPICTFVFPPSIDPLADKNRELAPHEMHLILDQYGLGTVPYLLQVARFDHFKDPVGVVHAFKEIRKHATCILVLVSGPAEDDPEQEAVLAETRIAAGIDPDIRLLFPPADSDIAINALQRGAAVVVQKSLREGFGLPVAEAMWKEKPVVGGRTTGISLQIMDGETGYLVGSIGEAADRVVSLLRDPELAAKMGQAARERVRRDFLITRELLDHYQMFSKLLSL
jgi:trehalose synthase